MLANAERDEVERPFTEQLKAMGWIHVPGSDLHRDSREHVLLADRLTTALQRINRLSDGSEWLDEERIAQVIGALNATPPGGLLEANQYATSMLLDGVAVPGHPHHHGGRRTTVDLIDWKLPDRNEFLVVDQFRVDQPSGDHAILDLVLFVNGIPLIVVECKSPDAADPITWAVEDLRAYLARRSTRPG